MILPFKIKWAGRERSHKIPFVTSLIRECKPMFYFVCAPSMISLTCLRKSVRNWVIPSWLWFFLLLLQFSMSLNFGGILKIHHLFRSKGRQKRQTGISVVFSSKEASIFSFKVIKSIHSFGAFLPSYWGHLSSRQGN